jgi:hypothetical protein
MQKTKQENVERTHCGMIVKPEKNPLLGVWNVAMCCVSVLIRQVAAGFEVLGVDGKAA